MDRIEELLPLVNDDTPVTDRNCTEPENHLARLVPSQWFQRRVGD